MFQHFVSVASLQFYTVYIHIIGTQLQIITLVWLIRLGSDRSQPSPPAATVAAVPCVLLNPRQVLGDSCVHTWVALSPTTLTPRHHTCIQTHTHTKKILIGGLLWNPKFIDYIISDSKVCIWLKKMKGGRIRVKRSCRVKENVTRTWNSRHNWGKKICLVFSLETVTN